MFVPGLIERKRDGGALTPGEWGELIAAYQAGTVPDYQMAALLMAVFLRGMTRPEIAALLDAMVASGRRLDFAGLGLPVVDKHSTGGVGDKVSLVLAPLAAACGLAVPMMSGRGLGHTGGTLDKLESIPGFRTALSFDETLAQIARIGVAMIGQTPEIAPVDKRLYAMRDVTATVECIPLIACSIMSKKLAEGLDGLVLDVKQGSGAFIADAAKSLELAQTMIALGEDRGCPTVALLTAMDRPLGRACGNALETEEAIMALRGEGPEDLRDETIALGVEMLLLGAQASHAPRAAQRGPHTPHRGPVTTDRTPRTAHRGPASADRAAAETRVREALASGKAAEKFQQMVEAQGGNPAVLEDPSVLPQAKEVEVYYAPKGGTVLRVEPRTIGRAVVEMGGGRTKAEDEVDPTVGFVITARPGQKVHASEALASIFAQDPAGIALGRRALDAAIQIGEGVVEPLPLLQARVTATGVEQLG
ncbi:MAG: thymidine phosphorylase [Gemmatimonadales bacterium]|jgi:pyrimidine-nucleoside phosphorylase